MIFCVRYLLLVASLFLVMASSQAIAAFTYTYIGDDYSNGTNGAFLTTPASPPRVSGSFTVATPLPPSRDIQLVSSQDLLSFSFNNGLETIDSDSNNVGIYMFSVSTNDQGEIISSVIQIQQWLSQPGVGNLLNDIEITNGNNRTYHHVGCTQINSNACTGINFITTGPDPSSYAVWTSGTWYSPLQVKVGQNPLYATTSTILTVSGGNGSSGTVTYQLVSGPCTLSGNLLTGTGTGDCIVTATQGADSLHIQETSAPTTVNVTQPPPLQVNAGQNPLPVSSSTTLSVSGGNGSTGTVTYQLVSGPCTLNADVITGTDLGDCVVKATQAADSLHPQMTSAPATITISLPPQSTLYVSANPSSIGPSQTTSLTTSGGSGTGAVSYQLLSGPCTLSGSILSGTSVGTCIVTASKAGDSGYAPITAPAISVAVSLTPQIWSAPPSNLSQPAYEFDLNTTQLALSSDGTRAAAVWWVYDGTHAKVQFSSAIINGNVAEWIDPVDISPPGMDAVYPQIALSADGSKAIAIWGLYDGSSSVIQSAVASLTGNQAIWSTPVTLTASGLDSGSPQVALSADGTKSIAIWQIHDGTHSVVQSSTAAISGVTATWSSAANVSSPDADSWNPQVLLAEDGSLSTAIWTHSDGGNTIIQSASASLSGNSASWGNIANLSATGSDADEPNFSLSGDGTKALSMWRQIDGRNEIFQSSAGTINGNIGTWGAPIDLSQPSLNTYSSQVTISEDGEKGAAIWSRSDTDFDLVESSTVSLAESGTSWSSPTILSQENHNSYLPKITISQDGTKATAIWMDGFGDIYNIQSTSASIIDNRATWGGAGNVSPTNEILLYPKLKLSRDGTKATAVWNAFSIGGFYNQSSSATILYTSLTPSTQTIVGSVGTAISPTTPFSAQGLEGTIHYSVNPALPAGLYIDSSTGIISGIPVHTQPLTPITVYATGSIEGAAEAAINFEIIKANQSALSVVITPNTLSVCGSSMLSTSGGSGTGSVSYTLAEGSPCTLQGETLTGLAQGICTITATKSADADYDAVSNSKIIQINRPPKDHCNLVVPKVTVDQPGNLADPANQAGSVAYSYQMGQFDITIGQYTAFLNAIAQSDPHKLYNPNMATDLQVAGISRTGAPGHYRYELIAPAGPARSAVATAAGRPIAYVSWFDAARFANWMSNGQPTGSQTSKTTEDGAYRLSNAQARKGLAVPRNMRNPNTGLAAAYFLPTEDEWYKAAYYNPTLNDGKGGYTRFATNSDTLSSNQPGADWNAANLIHSGVFATTQKEQLTSQNYLTDVGSFPKSSSSSGTFDMNGNVWEIIDPATTPSVSIILRGGGWNSFHTSMQSVYRSGTAPEMSGSSTGMRLTSEARTIPSSSYEMVRIKSPGNRADKTGFGAVGKEFWIGKYEVTIGDYVAFLNAVAKTDPYDLYDLAMSEVSYSAGISRSGSTGNYSYAPINNSGDSSLRPITFVNWFDAARYANWMSNGQPGGAQDGRTTEDGAYPLHGITGGHVLPPNMTNPNTGAPPLFQLPTEDQWYKAAYYNPKLNGGRGGYYLYATKSIHAPGNQIGTGSNMANYVDDANGSYFYCVPQARYVNLNQNYLTDTGAYSGSASYFGTYDQTGLLYQWNDLDGKTSAWRGLRGGVYYYDSGVAQSQAYHQVSPNREANDSTFRLTSPH